MVIFKQNRHTNSKKYKFSPFKLAGGAKLHKNFVQKLLAVSLCAALVLCAVPLRGGSYVSEATTESAGSGTVLTLTYDEQTGVTSAAWTEFDLFSSPAVDVVYTNKYGVPTDVLSRDAYVGYGVGVPENEGLPFVIVAWCASGDEEFRYEAPVFDDGPAAGDPQFDTYPRCVSAWAGAPWVALHFGERDTSGRVSVPPLPEDLLVRFDGVPVQRGSSTRWFASDEGRTIAHCDECVVTLEAEEGAPVTVAGNENDGWTITRTADGDTTLDLLIGDFKVGELTVTEPLTLDAKVQTKFGEQTVRVVDINNVLPAGTQLHAETVETHKGIDNTHEIEHVFSYQISLLDATGVPLNGQLDAPVELYFEVLDGLDEKELEVVLVNSGVDREFIETIVDDVDGSSWVKVTTDHFSPYALIDTLSAEEKAALNAQTENDPPASGVPTGDVATQTAVAGLGIVLVLALGIMLRINPNKRKFQD